VLIEDGLAVSIDETEQADMTVFAEVWLKKYEGAARARRDRVIYSISNRCNDRNYKIWCLQRWLLMQRNRDVNNRIFEMCGASEIDKKRRYSEKHLCTPALPISMVKGGDKRKMKTQIVAILAIAAVITTLLTVNAVSNEVGYKLSPCDAIDLSLENTAVTDFLNATNMTTVQVYNFKGYKGENTWMVQWSSSDRLLDVYVNVATGAIVGIEEKTCLGPTPTPTPTLTPTPKPTAETKTWHSVITFMDRGHKKSEPFTIKGDVWRVNYTVNPVEGKTDLSIFSVHVYPENETIISVSSWKCWFESCNSTEYISEGNADYYLEVIASSNSWKLEVEDYY